MSTIISTNPATGVQIKTYDLHTDEMIADRLEAAQKTWQEWRQVSFAKRSELMMEAAQVLESKKETYAKIMTAEMGKTYRSAIAEVEKCAWVCRYYAENAAGFLADEFIDTDATKSGICYQPLGVILAVMPWNYPMWQVFRFAAPALMAGNVAVLKHASNVPESALRIEEVFRLAGFPKGAFNTLLIKSDQVKAIIENPVVKAVTLTGSEGAGAAVSAAAAKQLKKSVLELGGSDPYIILEDADLEHAAEQCCQSRLLNAGQSCIGAKRFIIVEPVYEKFLQLFADKMKNAKMGDPMGEVDLGPLARRDLREEVHNQVMESVQMGAKLLIGGEVPEGDGAFYPPTILTDVAPGMPAYEEEIFGPVASVFRAADESDALRIANDTTFGLGACVFTRDLTRGERIAKHELNAGCCFVNAFVKSDPRLPFGGINRSGFGRELSHLGIREFVNTKTFYVK